MRVDISIKEIESHQSILERELREVYQAIDCLRVCLIRQNVELDIDYYQLSEQINYLNNHAEWINNRLSFLSKAAQKASHLTDITKESIDDMIKMLNN